MRSTIGLDIERSLHETQDNTSFALDHRGQASMIPTREGWAAAKILIQLKVVRITKTGDMEGKKQLADGLLSLQG